MKHTESNQTGKPHEATPLSFMCTSLATQVKPCFQPGVRAVELLNGTTAGLALFWHLAEQPALPTLWSVVCFDHDHRVIYNLVAVRLVPTFAFGSDSALSGFVSVLQGSVAVSTLPSLAHYRSSTATARPWGQ